MAYEFRTTRRVEFSETDAAGIVHFAQFFRYMEQAEHAFYRSLGTSVHRNTEDGGMEGWPRVEATCQYIAPLHFEDEVEVHLLVRDKSDKAIRYDFMFWQLASQSGPVEPKLAARGGMTVIYVVRRRVGERIQTMPMPEPFASQIETAPLDAVEQSKVRVASAT